MFSKPRASSSKIYSENILLFLLCIVIIHSIFIYSKRDTLLKIHSPTITISVPPIFPIAPQGSLSTLPLCAPESPL